MWGRSRCNGPVVIGAHWSDETVTPARQGFYIPGIVGSISERVPETLDGGVQAMIEVHERVRWPELGVQFFAGDHLPWSVKKGQEYLEGLILQTDAGAVSAKFTRTHV